jgi:hypothetical protein
MSTPVKSVLLVLVVLLALVSTARAQTLAPNEVYVAQSFQVVATHDGVNATHYRLYRAGVLIQTLASTARNATTGDVTFPAISNSAIGSIVYEVSAVNINTTGEAESPRLAYTVVVKLAPPTQPNPLTLPRIIKVAL